MGEHDNAGSGDLAGQAGYRRHSTSGKREPRGVMRFSLEEWAVIVQVAALERLRPGAWVHQAAFDAAVRKHRGQATDRSAINELINELREHRRVLTNIGGNLNDVARAANATGQIENLAAANTVLRLVRNVVLGSDSLVARVRAEFLP